MEKDERCVHLVRFNWVVRDVFSGGIGEQDSARGEVVDLECGTNS